MLRNACELVPIVLRMLNNVVNAWDGVADKACLQRSRIPDLAAPPPSPTMASATRNSRNSALRCIRTFCDRVQHAEQHSESIGEA